MSKEQRLNGHSDKRDRRAWDDFESLKAANDALEEENEKLWEQKTAYERALLDEMEWHDSKVRALPDGPEMREHDEHARRIRGLVNGYNPKYAAAFKQFKQAVAKSTTKNVFDLGDEEGKKKFMKEMEGSVRRVIDEFSVMNADSDKHLAVSIEPDEAEPGRAILTFTGLTPHGNWFLRNMKEKMEA